MQQKSWFELVSKQFKGYPAWAVELGVFSILFLVIGFLVKSFGKLLFLGIILFGAFLAAAYYFNLAPEFLEQFKVFVGLGNMQILGDIPVIFGDWARDHVVALLGAIIGFMVGYKLG